VDKEKENTSNGILYIIDHWSGQTDPTLYEAFKKNDTLLQTEFVPEKTTAHCQPLDTFFNRQLKYLGRKICNFAMVHQSRNGNAEKLVDRNSILKMQSLIHFLLSAPVFSNMIKHSWFQAGLTKENPPFMNAFNICFKIMNSSCAFSECNTIPFINCSWCRKELCYEHFYIDDHMMVCELGPYAN